MRNTQCRARRGPRGGALSGLVLLVVAVVLTACGAPSAPPATPGTEPLPAANTQAAPQATVGTGPSAPFGTAEPGSQEAGASAELNPAARFTTHWKGDANAKVVIVEISDFQ